MTDHAGKVDGSERTIQLDQLLKREGLVGTGGEAKHSIQGGLVEVNGETETRRKRKLRPGDVVRFRNEEVVVDDLVEDPDPLS